MTPLDRETVCKKVHEVLFYNGKPICARCTNPVIENGGYPIHYKEPKESR